MDLCVVSENDQYPVLWYSHNNRQVIASIDFRDVCRGMLIFHYKLRYLHFYLHINDDTPGKHIANYVLIPGSIWAIQHLSVTLAINGLRHFNYQSSVGDSNPGLTDGNFLT